jgi:hypothetical protein
MGSELEMLVDEVRRLTREVEYLRQRVTAFEASRWWRLHPRFLIRRALGPLRNTPTKPSTSPRSSTTSAQTVDPVIARFHKDVVERGTFTHDWVSHRIVDWEPLYQELEGRGARLLEIGSFEGLSASFALWRLPDAHITCVDTFEGGMEHAAMGVNTSELERVFTSNVERIDRSRVRVLVGDSRRLLLDLAGEDREFDLVYVDGSHLGLNVIVDAALSWQLLASEGFLIFDDYSWSDVGGDALLRPGPAIDAFLALMNGKYELLQRDTQVVIRKI